MFKCRESGGPTFVAHKGPTVALVVFGSLGGKGFVSLPYCRGGERGEERAKIDQEEATIEDPMSTQGMGRGRWKWRRVSSSSSARGGSEDSPEVINISDDDRFSVRFPAPISRMYPFEIWEVLGLGGEIPGVVEGVGAMTYVEHFLVNGRVWIKTVRGEWVDMNMEMILGIPIPPEEVERREREEGEGRQREGQPGTSQMENCPGMQREEEDRLSVEGAASEGERRGRKKEACQRRARNLDEETECNRSESEKKRMDDFWEMFHTLQSEWDREKEVKGNYSGRVGVVEERTDDLDAWIDDQNREWNKQGQQNEEVRGKDTAEDNPIEQGGKDEHEEAENEEVEEEGETAEGIHQEPPPPPRIFTYPITHMRRRSLRASATILSQRLWWCRKRR